MVKYNLINLIGHLHYNNIITMKEDILIVFKKQINMISLNDLNDIYHLKNFHFYYFLAKQSSLYLAENGKDLYNGLFFIISFSFIVLTESKYKLTKFYYSPFKLLKASPTLR